MGCNCKKTRLKEKTENRSQALIEGRVKTVQMVVLQIRKRQCRRCPYATKNSHPKYAKFSGLTNQSQCKLAKRLLREALKDPLFNCPKSKFPDNGKIR